MAQTGYTPILIYSSSTAAAAPAAGSLINSTLGSELAINITDGKLFYKDNANAIQVIGWKVVPATSGGTGLISYTQGDLLYATSSTTLGRLADVATGNALISGGVGADPSWGKIGLTTHVSGTLPVANGGTNASTASITAFNNITGYTASGATGTTSTNLVFSTSPSLTTPRVITSINDTNGNELFGVTATASAVNELTIANAATGNNPALSATGGDTNIGINLTPKGTGKVTVTNDATINTMTVGRGPNNNTGNFVAGTGFTAITTAAYCTSIGTSVLANTTTGDYSTSVGHASLNQNVGGTGNTAVGVNGLFSNTSGNNNTCIGNNAGYGTGSNANTTGSNNTFIGNESVGATATASNVITLGNSSIATLRCQVTTISSLSDQRDKKNIQDIPAGLEFVNALRPVEFDWNMRDGGKIDIHEFGFIAQELYQAQVDTGITVPNLVSIENPEKLEAAPGTLLPILVKAIQELSEQVGVLKEQVALLKGAE
jgi:trimeric autotransporter adhesin